MGALGSVRDRGMPEQRPYHTSQPDQHNPKQQPSESREKYGSRRRS